METRIPHRRGRLCALGRGHRAHIGKFAIDVEVVQQGGKVDDVGEDEEEPDGNREQENQVGASEGGRAGLQDGEYRMGGYWADGTYA